MTEVIVAISLVLLSILVIVAFTIFMQLRHIRWLLEDAINLKLRLDSLQKEKDINSKP